ncbi:hypothetical protein EON80_25600 [bacterium]|nr:MAG: hypothetical protein EON80_25600 [bacterium]
MNKLLFGLVTALLVTPVAHAQESPSFALPIPKWPSTASELEPVAGKPGIFVLPPGSYDVRELLTKLAAKTGGKAIFDNKFRMTNLYLYQPFQGTVPEIIERLGVFSFTVGQVGTDWVFVQKEVKPFALKGTPSSVLSPTEKVEPFNFNLNPTPGRNLPPSATPFEFNGNGVYHVPVRSK